MIRKEWGLALPAILGLGLAGLLRSGWIENPIVYLRAQVSLLALLIGLLGSAAALAGASIWRRAHQRAYRQAQAWAAEDRRRFLRRLDHELRNPLTAIRAGLVNLAEASGLEVRREALDSVGAQTRRISRLTGDLRKLAELETRPLELTPVNLAELLQHAVTVVQEKPEAANRRVLLTVPQAPWPLPTISGDRDLLFLAIYNLLDNAIKFTRPNDTVEVRAFEDGARVVMEVADTGPGIPAEELQHVWEELYRGQGARGVPGSGLGLALVRTITERHQGQVTLRSRERQGTVFTVRLPVGAHPLQKLDSEEQAGSSRSDVS